VHLKLAGLPAPPLAHILGDLREQHIHIDAPIHLALDGAAKGVRSLFQKYRLKLVNYWHVKRVDLDLQQAHLSLHLIYSGFSLLEPLGADNVLGLTPRILGKGDLRIHLIDDLGKIGGGRIDLQVQTIQPV
jgi:hypothetical protein